MRMPTFIALFGSVALLTGCAHQEREEAKAETREFVASEPADVSTQKITRYADEDRDGFVTRKEAKADPALAAAFDRYDVDDNDKLDRGEFARLEADRRARSGGAHGHSHDATTHGDRWQVEKPDGYFGPERDDSLNRIGSRPARTYAD
jgi:hypothetical protein